jgi:hypothetical protein
MDSIPVSADLLADWCTETALKFEYGHELRNLLLMCRARLLADTKTIADLEGRIDKV